MRTIASARIHPEVRYRRMRVTALSRTLLRVIALCGTLFVRPRVASAQNGGPSLPPLLEGDGATFLLDQKTTSQALFGNLAWSPSKRWTLGLGGRLTFEKKDAHLANSCFMPGVVCRVIGIEEFDIERRRSETDVSPRVTVQYFPYDELALFATRAQGFKSGGFNNFGFTRRYLEVEPEETVGWEAGARGKLLDETLSYGATLFNMDVKDLQLQNVTAGQIQVRNAASARSRGLECDFLWLTPWQPLTFRGAGALTEARFRKFPNAPAPHSSASAEQDLSGRPMPLVPKTQLAFTPEVRLPFVSPALGLVGSLLPRDLVLKTSLDVVYRTSQFLDYDLDPVTRQSAYALLDGHIAIASGDGTWSLGASVENATDADVKEAMASGSWISTKPTRTRIWSSQAASTSSFSSQSTRVKRARLLSLRCCRTDARHAMLRRPVTGWRQLEMPIELGRALLVLGKVQRRRGERRLAREALTEGLAIFRDHGATLWAERAAEELSRIPIRRGAPDDLTPTEELVWKPHADAAQPHHLGGGVE